MAKVKNKKQNKSDNIHRSKKVSNKPMNPFEMHINKEKMRILGRKQKNSRGLPGVSKGKAIEKRKRTLLKEYEADNKTNSFSDRRIGEMNNTLTQEERTIARYTAIRVKQHNKKSKFNLADDEVLTHKGQMLSLIEKYEDPRSDNEDSDDNNPDGKLNREFVKEAHFGGGLLKKADDGVKTHRNLIDQLIAESKKRKAEKQKQKEATVELTEKLDTEWKDLLPIISKTKHVEPEVTKETTKVDDYDKIMKELKFEARGTPTDRLKTEDEIAREDKEKLENLERDRISRMRGLVSESKNHRSADDLEDNFVYESFDDVLLSYNEHGEANVECNALLNNTSVKVDENDEESEENEEKTSDNEDNNSDNENNHSDAENDNSDSEEDNSEDNFSDLKENDSESENEEDIETNSALLEKETNISLSNDLKEEKTSLVNDSKIKRVTKDSLLPKTNANDKQSINNDKQTITNDKLAKTNDKLAKTNNEPNINNDKQSINKIEPSSNKIQTDLSNRREIMEKARKELPYTFSFPDNYDNMKQLLENHTAIEHEVILERIIKCNHPSLSEDNKDKLNLLFVYLLQYIHDLSGLETNCLRICLHIIPALFDLTQLNADNASCSFIELLKEKRTEFKNTLKVSIDTIVYLRTVSCIFSTSDYRHLVVTPSLVFMEQMLQLAKIRSRKDMVSSLFLVTLMLEYTSFSKRFSPASINFLGGIFHSAIPQSKMQLLKILPPFKSTLSLLVVTNNCSSHKLSTKLDTKYLFNSNSTADNDDLSKLSIISIALKLAKEIHSNCSTVSSSCELFSSILKYLKKLPVENYPEILQVEINEFIKSLEESVSHRKLTYIVMEAKKPKALRLYEPNVQKIYDSKSHRVQSKDKTERDKLLHKLKREQKGAIREIRKDRSFLGRHKINKQMESDYQRKEKVKRIYSEASMQQCELNSIDRANKRKRK